MKGSNRRTNLSMTPKRGRVAQTGRRARRLLTPYVFILPAVLAMLFVHYVPMINGAIVSFKDVNLFTVTQWLDAPWVGLQNFIEGFNPEQRLGNRFWRSLWNVTLFGLVTITVSYVIGMAVALLLNRPFRGRNAVRAFILLPYITPDSVAFSLWRFMFQARIGLMNKWLLGLGLVKEPPIWLVGNKSLYAVMVASIWKGWPFAALILQAGLQSISKDLYEAAMVDGAGPWHRFRHITLPLLAPVSRTLILLSILWNYNAFNQFHVMLGRDPGLAADVPSTLILRESFTTFDFGVGSAMSLALMAIMLIFTAIYLRALRSPQGGNR